ncbi:MAG: pseudouridine synthase [Chitinophagaceae bacterium]
MSSHRYFLLYKPVNMVSQFVSSDKVRLLGAIDFNFPEGTHAIGRLDKDSEGLLLLTTDKKVTRLLFQGKMPHKRTYLVQVKNVMTTETASLLSSGIAISAPMGGEYMTTPCEVELVDKPVYIQDAEIPLHEKVKNSWVKITLTEGKFHQVRKMVAAVQHKCVRLIRTTIEGLTVYDLLPGQVKEVTQEYFYEKLKL